MNSIDQIAIEAAKKAGGFIQQCAGDLGSLNIEQKSLHDYVSEVDRKSEGIIFEIISKHFPTHAFIGEEFGDSGVSSSEYQWIVDPLDGTTNYLRGVPHYAVSIAVTRHSVLQHAVIFDPAKGELFSAHKGGGAFLNGEPMKVSNPSGFAGALLATGIPFNGDNLAQITCFTATMEALLAKQTSGIRRLGSAALDLAYVASGRFDGYWEANLQAWDIAAGALIVEEAGGCVGELNGGCSFLESGNIVAAGPAVYKEMVDVTRKTYKNKAELR